MSCEQNYSSEVVVLNECPEFEIATKYPHTIRKIKTKKVVKPTLRKDGYYSVWLNGKHR